MRKKKLNFSMPENRKKSAKEKMQDEESPFGESIIQPTEFYSDETGKTKWNWFLFELALSFESYIKIKNCLDKKLRKWKIGEKEIADFSIHTALDMRDTILSSISGKGEYIDFSREMVESYFPAIKENKLIGEIVDALAEALAFQLDSCGECVTRCLIQRDQYCTMFDTGPYG